MKDEDIMFEQRRQAMIDPEAWNSAHSIPWHQKVGTTVPFSRTVDRDPNPRIPFSVAVPKISKREVITWLLIAAGLLAATSVLADQSATEQQLFNQREMIRLQQEQVDIQHQQLQEQRQRRQSSGVYVMERPDYGGVIRRALKQYEENKSREQW